MEKGHYEAYLDRLDEISGEVIDLGQQLADLAAEMRADPPTWPKRVPVLGVCG